MIGTIVVLAAAFGGFGATVGAEDPEPGRRTVDLVFELPADQDPRVVVTFDEAGLHLDLPGDSGIPLDLVSAGGGLIESADVGALSDGRTRVVIALADAGVDQVLFQAGAFVVRLRDWPAGPDRAADGGDRLYRLGPDDKILVTVDGHPDLTQQLSVRRNGTVAAPLVGELPAEGLTVQELNSRLRELLGEQYLVDPRVDVEVVEYNSQWVVVSGAIRLPGRVALRGGTLLTEVIADAGGFGDEAGQEIVISKAAHGGHEQESVRIARRDFESGAINPVLEHGDLVNVARVSYCYVNGEVRRPGRVEIEPGMTLLRAISLVGGLTEWANRKEVKIIRSGAEDSGSIHNIKRIQGMKEPDPKLEGDEIVIVPRRFL